MSRQLVNELWKQVRDTATDGWNRRDGRVVPEAANLALGNDRVELEAVFLYADLADSTELAIGRQQIAAEVCKAYISGVTKLVKHNGGEVRSFDGDRVMGVFIEGPKNTNAVRCALQINTFFRYILAPEFTGYYKTHLDGFNLSQTVGVDRSDVYVCRAGARIDNDLIWVGRAPNIAAKLSGVRNGYSTLVTDAVYTSMLPEVTNDVNSGNNLWHTVTVPGMPDYGVKYVAGTTAEWIFANV